MAYFGKEYTKENMENALNEMAKERFHPMHIDTQEAYAVIICERET